MGAVGLVAAIVMSIMGASAAAAQAPPAGEAFVASFSPTTVRNDFSGWVGMRLTVGPIDLSVTDVGRWAIIGNSGTHTVRLVHDNGTDVVGGSAVVDNWSAIAPGFHYASLPAPVTLAAGTSYYLLSEEFAGGDTWYDYDTNIVTSGAGTNTGAAYAYPGTPNSIVSSAGPGQSWVPPNFLYTTATSGPAVTTHPADQTVVEGTTATFSASASGTPTPSVQWQVEPSGGGGFTDISGATSPTLSIPATSLAMSGNRYRAVFTSTGGSVTTDPATLTVTVAPPPPLGDTPWITSFTPSTLRNDFSGWVGLRLTVGLTDVSVSALGRWVAPGNTGTHAVRLVDAAGVEVPGGSAIVDTAGATAGSFAYAALGSPVSLAANTTYFLLSQETAGGDSWYDYNLSTTTTPVAANTATAYTTDASPGTVVAGGSPGQAFGPPNFLYTTSPPPPPPPEALGHGFVTSFTPSTLRNDFSGWVGMRLTVGSEDLSVSALGRWAVGGDTGTHTVRLVEAATGLDVPGGSVAVPLTGATAGAFTYAPLASPITLAADTGYYLLSQEQAGGDRWYNYDITTVTATVGADINAAYATDADPSTFVVGGGTNRSYGPPNFLWRFKPTITTSHAPTTGIAGITAFGDEATVSDGRDLDGSTVTFDLYGPFASPPPADFCTVGPPTPVFTDPGTLAGPDPDGPWTATSATFSPTEAGTYYWVAGFVGDAITGHAISGCLDEPIIVEANDPPTVDSPSFDGAVGNTTFGVGTTPPEPRALHDGTPPSSVLGGATDPEGQALTAGPSVITTTNGGSVAMNADGTFTYEPPVGFTGSDVFAFTVSDGVNTVGGTATVVVTNRVWYLDNARVTNGNGKGISPFNVLSAVTGPAGPTAPGDYIYIYRGDDVYTGGLILKSDQTVWTSAAPHPFTVGGVPLITTGGPRPRITNAAGNGITMATGASVFAVWVDAATGHGIEAADTQGITLRFNTVTNSALAGVHMTGGGASTGPGFFIQNNEVHYSAGTGIQLDFNGSGTWEGTVSGNTIGDAAIDNSGSAGGEGISLAAGGTTTVTVYMQGNAVREVQQSYGILAGAQDGATLNLTLESNDSRPGGAASLDAFSIGSNTNTSSVCMNAFLNRAPTPAGPPGTVGMSVVQSAPTSTFVLQGYSGGSTDTTAVESYLFANNPDLTGADGPALALLQNGNTTGFTNGGCPTVSGP